MEGERRITKERDERKRENMKKIWRTAKINSFIKARRGPDVETFSL